MVDGHCVCGNVAYEYTGPPALTAVCHCTDCQRWTGTSGSSNVAVPTAAFSITQGTPKSFIRIGASGKNHAHFFCGNCGSSLYSQPDAMPGTTLIKAGGLSGQASDISPVGVEFYTKDRPSYARPINEAKQATTME